MMRQATDLPCNWTFAPAAEKVRNSDSSRSQPASFERQGILAEQLHLKRAYSRCRPGAGMELSAREAVQQMATDCYWLSVLALGVDHCIADQKIQQTACCVLLGDPVARALESTLGQGIGQGDVV